MTSASGDRLACLRLGRCLPCPSVWITARAAAGGAKRYRVGYRLGGRASRIRYGGSFKTKREAQIRRAYIGGELAARRVPELTAVAEPTPAPTFAEAAKRWQASRVDVAAATTVQHRSAINRALPFIGTRRLDELTSQDVAALVGALHGAGKSRESIRKTRTAVAMVLDHERISPNPARDPSVKLPREEPQEVQPPSAADVATVSRLIPAKHRLALLWLDWSGARVARST